MHQSSDTANKCRSHALGKASTTSFAGYENPRSSPVKMGDNGDLICDGGMRSGILSCAIQARLLVLFACAASASSFSGHSLWSWPCRSGLRVWLLRLQTIQRIACRQLSKRMLSISCLMGARISRRTATLPRRPKTRMLAPLTASLTFVRLF